MRNYIRQKKISYEVPHYAMSASLMYFMPLEDKYSPEHPVLIYSQIMF